jgi:predicted kinase
MACKIIYKGISYNESDFKSQIERYVAINNLFNENESLANQVYEALGFDKQINEIADTKKVDEFIKKYKDALPNIKDGKTLISHLQTVSNRNTGTTKQFADLIIKLSKSNKGLEKLLNNPNLYAKPNSAGDEGAFHWSLFSNLSVNKIVLELDHFKTNTYDDVFLHELIHNLTTQFIVKDSNLFNQNFYNKVKELYSVFDNHLEANKKVNEPLLKSTKDDVKNLKRLKEYFEILPSDAIQHELLFGKVGSISTIKDVKLDYKSLENKSKQDVIKELERLLSFKESRIQEIEKGDKDYYYFNSKTFKQENVLSEFLATFMNDANFREQLKNIDYKNNKSIFQSIIDLISEFIGLTKNDSLYNEFVLNLTNFINNNDYSTIAEQTQKTAYQNRINLLEQQKQQAQQLYSQYVDAIKPDVILPIGTSGSGKSTFIKSLPQENLVVIEPDAMRVEFTGNMNDKSKDKEIYIEAAKRAIKAIKQGKQVVFDTTNLTKDKRLPFIEAIKKEIPTAKIQYKLMELNPELAKQRIKAQLSRGENRAAVSDETIDRHAASYKQMLEDIKSEPITKYKELSSKQDIEGFKGFVGEFINSTSALKTSLGKELEYKDPYVPTGSLKNFKQYQVLDEKNNDIGSVVIEYRGDKTVILHPKLTITGKGYGKDLYKLVSSKFNVDIQEWSEGAIANTNAAKKMWDSLEKEGVAKRIVDEEQGDNFRILEYRKVGSKQDIEGFKTGQDFRVTKDLPEDGDIIEFRGNNYKVKTTIPNSIYYRSEDPFDDRPETKIKNEVDDSMTYYILESLSDSEDIIFNIPSYNLQRIGFKFIQDDESIYYKNLEDEIKVLEEDKIKIAEKRRNFREWMSRFTTLNEVKNDNQKLLESRRQVFKDLGFTETYDNTFELKTSSYVTLISKKQALDDNPLIRFDGKLTGVKYTQKSVDGTYILTYKLDDITKTSIREAQIKGEMPFTKSDLKETLKSEDFLNSVSENIFDGLSPEETQIIKEKLESGEYNINCKL